MSNNLLELINENITGDVISKLAEFLGESPKNTTSALSNAIPSLLAGLVNKSTDTDGASTIFNLLSQGSHDGSLLNNLVSAFSGGEGTSKLLSTGASLLTSVLGNKADGVTNLIANASGISKTSSSSLLGLVMPMIFGVLGKTVKSQGITSATGLASLLASQGGFLKNFLPAGLTSILGMVGSSSLGQGTTPLAANVPYVAEESSDGFGSWLPWLLLPAILALGWGFLKYFKAPQLTVPETSIQQANAPVAPAVTAAPEVAVPTATAPEVSTAPTEAPAVAAPEAVAPTATAAPIVEQISDFFEKTLSSGFAIKAAKDGIENKLIGFLEDANRAADKDTWFTMNGIVFDSGKATLKPESNVQITNIAEIMKAFPTVKIKIGGYTDNTGNAKSNVKLSAARAKAVSAALVAAGMDAARLDAEGFGSEHPVASNDTEAGKQQNRRIDVRVTAK
ncbi:MAG: OmpA family protein [Methylococcales bacterium]